MGEGDYARASFHLRKSLDIYRSTYESLMILRGDLNQKAGGHCD